MLALSAKTILAYAGLPRFKMRLQELFLSGFQFVAYFMALVYAAVNLLPANHAYTQGQNIGKFGIRHVIAEAANHLVIKKENIDQIILFVALLIGMALMFMQILLLGVGMFIQPVLASVPTSFTGFFVTASPERDIAHIMMDLVFGIPANSAGDHFFGSCITNTAAACQETNPQDIGGTRDVMVTTDSAGASESIFVDYGYPFPIHRAMHSMFQLYNTGLLVVGVMITSYFIFTVVAETAQTGTAFGKRFNKVWAPIRIVFAFGMLVPVGFGFSGSQFAVLYAAKFGSAFATNGWNLFNEQLSDSYGGAVRSLFGDEKTFITQPNIPELGALLQFMFTARTCAHAEEMSTSDDDTVIYNDTSSSNPREIGMFAVKGAASVGGDIFIEINDGTTYEQFMTFLNGPVGPAQEMNGIGTIRFGRQDSEVYSQYKGSVRPYCGEITFKLTDPKHPGATPPPEEGLRIMQEFYWELIRDLWFVAFDTPGSYTAPAGGLPAGVPAPTLPSDNFPLNVARTKTQWDRDLTLPLPQENYRSLITQITSARVYEVMTRSGGALEEIQNSDRYVVNNLIREKGWAGAAIWYNRIAEMNGAVTTAVLNVPYPSLYPDVMEHIYRKKKLLNQDVSFSTRYQPFISEEDTVKYRKSKDAQIANALWWAFNLWQADANGSSTHAAPTGNAMIDSINAVFGTEGLYNIRRNPESHPLAQVVGVGRSLVEASIRNLTLSVAGGSAANLLGFIDSSIKSITKIQSSFLVTVTMVALTAGFVLFYIVPFLPFIYFFFAVGGWIKGIFEAMVGAPLWALAHIRIDGNGLPGQAGVAGYFLIFEIFIRPILIVFGMLASISIFSALVSVLHQTFDLVTANVGGFDHGLELTGSFVEVGGTATSVPAGTEMLDFARNAVDEFFFTVIYTIIIYLMAMSSFKLIDLIPNNILRWMGQSVATFNDQREDAAQGLVGKATIGAQQTSSALGGGLRKIAGA